jgi:ABC-type glycerol-3-phosphate transport system substrate-binding protein
MTTDSIGNIRVLYINKDKAQDYGLTVPYQDVFDGTWTIDKLTDMTKDVYADINGNGEIDEDDFFGFEYRDQYFICTLEPLGITPYKRDTEEIIKLNLNNERTLVAIDKMYSLLFDSKSTFFQTDNKEDNIFLANRALTTCLTLSVAVDKLRFTDVNYGILPMPKLEASQENYTSGYTSYLFAVPNTSPDLERTGIIIEAMSAEGYKRVLPAYNEIALKNKYLQDEESIKVLDLINESKMLDFAWCYNVNYTGPYWFMRDLFIGGKIPSTDFASWYEKNENRLQKHLDNIIIKFEDMQGN